MKNIKNGNALRARILGKVFASARLLLAAYLVSSIVEPAALSAGVPPGINYQGRYVADNVPFTGNKSNCQFKIYDDPTSGTLRWSSPAVSLDFDRGLFNYVIACSTHDWRTYESYLEVVIDGVTLSPRERLQASPYAFFSSSAAYSYDADKIDNIDSSALVQIAGNQNITGVKTFTSSVTINADFRATGTVWMPLVVSSQALTTAWVDSPDNTTDTDVENMSVTLNVPFAPALIFGHATLTHNGGGAGAEIQVTHMLLIDGNYVSEAGFHGHTGANDSKRHSPALSAARRVTSTGNYIVKVMYKVSSGSGFYHGPRNILAYAIPTQ